MPFEGLWAGNLKRLLGSLGNGRFGPSPGREPSGTIGKRPFLTKSWPGAFGQQLSAIWRPLGRQLKFSSGTIGKRPFWAKSWPGAFWEHISAIWRPLSWQLKFPSGTIGKRPFWAKSWPGAFLGAAFCHLAAPQLAIEIPFWDHWETAVLGQILAGSLFGSNFLPFGRPWAGN